MQGDESDDPRLDLITRRWVSVQPAISVFVRSVVASRAEAEDIVQEVALTVVRRRHDYDPDASFYSWARSIAHFQVMNWKRKCARSRLVFDDRVITRIAEVSDTDAGDRYEDYRLALRGCIDRLTGRAADVIRRFYHQEQSAEQIAASLGTTTNTISVTLTRARGALRDCVAARLKSKEAGHGS